MPKPYAFVRLSQGYIIKLHSLPNRTEIQACWALCRLHNTLWLLGRLAAIRSTTSFDRLLHYMLTKARSLVHCNGLPLNSGNIGKSEAIKRAALYVPFCFGIKSLIMIIDDILDHDIDGLVVRTKSRTLPRGAISLERAWIFFAVQVVLGVYLAIKCLEEAALYTSMTRWTYFAPILLGIMFNVGVFMGWCDLTRTVNVPWEILGSIYIGACCWTVTYETIYQHQDRQNDVKIGLKSLAILCGRYTIPVCTITGSAFVVLMVYGGLLNGQGIPFFVSVAVVGFLLSRSLWHTNIDEPENCMALFLGTPFLGQIILGGLILDAVLHRWIEGLPL
ncbi:UbiA prenyltransferase [Mycena leptocephala]|nr:UbiA prenyltransferase [Mycena leptocephala]